MNTIIHESRTHRRKSEEIPIPSRQLCLYHPATHPPLLILYVPVLSFPFRNCTMHPSFTTLPLSQTPESHYLILVPSPTLPYPPLPYPTGSRGRGPNLCMSRPYHSCLLTPRGSPPPRHSLTDLFVRSVGVSERERIANANQMEWPGA